MVRIPVRTAWSWRRLAVALGLTVAVACLAMCRSAPHRPRVFVIGWDGASPRVVRELLDEGRLPNLQRMVDGGAYGALATLTPTVSPAIWTSVATGVPPREHGIRNFAHPTRNGTGYRLYNATDRRAAPLWTIASDAGLQVDVVGWWATWPADDVNGTMISDRFAVNRMGAVEESQGHELVAADQVVVRHGVATPDGAFEAFADCRVDPAAAGATYLDQLIAEAPLQAHPEVALARYTAGRAFYAQDETHRCIVRRLLSQRVPDLLLAYFEAPDVAGHLLWRYRYPEEYGRRSGVPVPKDLVAKYGDGVAAAYVEVDRKLGEILAHADENTTVVVLSDHGMTTRVGAKDPYFYGGHGSAPPGILVMWGRGVRPGTVIRGAHVYDVAPTLLALLSLPGADNMVGRVLSEALTLDLSGRAPPVPAYPVRVLELPAEAGDEDELIDRLEAIGYTIRHDEGDPHDR